VTQFLPALLTLGVAASTAVYTAGVNPAVIQGLDIVVEDDRVTIMPGICRVDGRRVRVKEVAVFSLPPAGDIRVEDEISTLTAEKPEGWARGTRLKGCISAGTTLPGCLVGDSVVVKLSDGTVLQEGEDYLVDHVWGMLGRIEGGRIGPDTQVKVSYRYGLMRLDAIQVASDGRVSLVQGKPEKTCPHPPAVGDRSITLAHLFMPYHTASLEAWQVFVAGRPYPEPNKAEMKRRSKLVPKTLRKLRKGERVVIVTWGDSVTAGGDASAPDKAFPNLFVTRLRERFPKADIAHVNAAIGGTNTAQRLPDLQKEVLSFHPDLVTIEFVNDMGFPADLLRKNYYSAIDQIRAAGGEAILITPHFTMPQWMGLPYPRGKETRAAVPVLREIASEKNIALADTSRRWEHLETEGLPYTTLLYNGINHPDDRGHELFVKDLLTFFPAR